MFPMAVRHSPTVAILAASRQVRKSTRGRPRPLNRDLQVVSLVSLETQDAEEAQAAEWPRVTRVHSRRLAERCGTCSLERSCRHCFGKSVEGCEKKEFIFVRIFSKE